MKEEKGENVNPLLASNDHNESTFTIGINNEPKQIEVKVISGGPVTPLFQAKVDIRHKFLSFSQRRIKGFRSAFEFDRKRVMVADEK